MPSETPASAYVTANGLRLHYLDWGGSGQPMLLLHGMSGNAHAWDYFAEAVRSNYRVIALDQRGHGESGWADSYLTSDFASDALSVIKQLGLGKVILVGHSMGGRNAIVFAARHPELVAKLIIVDIGPDLALAGLKRMMENRSAAPTEFSSQEVAMDFVRKDNPRLPETSVRHRVAHGLVQRSEGKWEWKHDPGINRLLGRAGYEDLWAPLPRIACPTLIVRGAESDVLSPEIALRMKELIPVCDYVEVPDAAHSIPAENPAGFEQALRSFLGE